MKKELSVIAVNQNKRGMVQFAELDEKGNPKNDVLVTINFKDPKEAAQFEIDKKVTVSIGE